MATTARHDVVLVLYTTWHSMDGPIIALQLTLVVRSNFKDASLDKLIYLINSNSHK